MPRRNDGRLVLNLFKRLPRKVQALACRKPDCPTGVHWHHRHPRKKIGLDYPPSRDDFFSTDQPYYKEP